MNGPVAPPPAYRRPLPQASITISYLGVQAEDAVNLALPLAVLADALRKENGPAVVERARFTDGAGYENQIFIAYWLRRDDFDRWFSRLQPWWEAAEREAGAVGMWREVVSVPTARFENIFSSPVFAVGSGRLAPAAEGPIEAHGYWGSMRDRLAASADDPLSGSEQVIEMPRDGGATRGRRVAVSLPPNLALIRSGQDTSRCLGEERAEYEQLILPVLGKGMDFLRDHPGETGCVSSRFLQELDADGQPTARSFGHAMFLSLADLERWSETHPTHLAIFHRFSAFARRRGPDLKLDLWHEVAVPEAGHGLFEYVNCHAATGLLRLAP